MTESGNVIRTEVHGLDVCLGSSVLALTRQGEPVIAPILLSSADADRLRLEMAKAQLWEWNQLEEFKSKAESRYKHYLGAWLVLCLAAFSAFVGHPSYYLPCFSRRCRLRSGGERGMSSGKVIELRERKEIDLSRTGNISSSEPKIRTRRRESS